MAHSSPEISRVMQNLFPQEDCLNFHERVIISGSSIIKAVSIVALRNRQLLSGQQQQAVFKGTKMFGYYVEVVRTVAAE